MFPSKNETGYTHSDGDYNDDDDDGNGDEGTGAAAEAAKGSSTQRRVRVSKNRFVAQNETHAHSHMHSNKHRHAQTHTHIQTKTSKRTGLRQPCTRGRVLDTGGAGQGRVKRGTRSWRTVLACCFDDMHIINVCVQFRIQFCFRF